MCDDESMGEAMTEITVLDQSILVPRTIALHLEDQERLANACADTQHAADRLQSQVWELQEELQNVRKSAQNWRRRCIEARQTALALEIQRDDLMEALLPYQRHEDSEEEEEEETSDPPS